MNIHEILATQHADYEADLEPDNYGLDDCPSDNPTIVCDDNADITMGRPCAYCGFTDCERCLDGDSPYSHIAARRGW